MTSTGSDDGQTKRWLVEYETGPYGQTIDQPANLRDVPVLAAVWVAALASTAAGRWDNFNALLVENTVPDPNFQGQRVAIIESVSPWGPFGNGEVVAPS